MALLQTVVCCSCMLSRPERSRTHPKAARRFLSLVYVCEEMTREGKEQSPGDTLPWHGALRRDVDAREEGCAMPAMPLTTAIATYGHTKALKDGTIQSERVVLEHIDVSPITSAFRRMVRTLAFDVSEMAFSTYLCARVYHKPITALPVFLLRRFEHGAMVYNVKSGIQSPLDLHGRRVGVRSYTLTPGVWIRGILQSAYGVNPQQVQWVLFGDEHVAEYVAPSNVTPAPAGSDMVAMLLAGEIDAAIGVSGVDAPEIRPLIPEPQQHRDRSLPAHGHLSDQPPRRGQGRVTARAPVARRGVMGPLHSRQGRLPWAPGPRRIADPAGRGHAGDAARHWG